MFAKFFPGRLFHTFSFQTFAKLVAKIHTADVDDVFAGMNAFCLVFLIAKLSENTFLWQLNNLLQVSSRKSMHSLSDDLPSIIYPKF